MRRPFQACGLVAVVMGVACGTEPNIERSPLATWQPSQMGLFPQTRTEGTLDISTNCVRLILDSQELVLLIWPEPTSWDATDQTIAFVSPWNERLELQNGDRIELGGATPIRESNFVLFPPPGMRGRRDVPPQLDKFTHRLTKLN